MKKHLIAIAIIAASCSPIQKSDQPETFYGDQKMAAILTDAYLMHGATSINTRSLAENNLLIDRYIYDKHQTDSTTFKENFRYYTDREELYLELLEQVDRNLMILKDTIAARQQQINTQSTQLKAVTKDTVKSPIKSYPKRKNDLRARSFDQPD